MWWTSAEHIDDVVASLAELGALIGVPAGDDITLACQETVHRLSRGLPTKRWILVFDNADSPEQLARYFPKGGGGHILVTSRNQGWAQQGLAEQIDVFLREESVEHLIRRTDWDRRPRRPSGWRRPSVTCRSRWNRRRPGSPRPPPPSSTTWSSWRGRPPRSSR
ncbi:hypothetical protein SALBM217S_07582 [Streptomyces griseoloalbus]